MKTRIRKWEGYRKTIDSYTGEGKEPFAASLQKEDEKVLNHLQSSKGAISMEGEEASKSTPYDSYVSRSKKMLFFKLASFIIVAVGLVLMYFFYVI